MKIDRLILAGAAAALLICPPALAAEGEKRPVPVETMTVTPQDLAMTASAVGKAAAWREVSVSAQAAGEVISHAAEVGEAVSEGQVLVRLDDTDYRLALEEARAALDSARVALETAAAVRSRYRGLASRQAITPDALERAEAEYKSLSATVTRAAVGVKLAEKRLERTRIRAPFAARVAARLVEKGQLVGAGTPVYLLSDISKVRINTFVNQWDYVELDKSDPVEVAIAPLGERRFEGQVETIGLKADALTNTFGVAVAVENPEGLIKPGFTATAVFELKTLPNQILIPASAVLYRQEGPAVFLAQAVDSPAGCQARFRPVRLGASHGAGVVVEEGLAPGERLVTVGQNYLEDGSPCLVKGQGR